MSGNAQRKASEKVDGAEKTPLWNKATQRGLDWTEAELKTVAMFVRLGVACVIGLVWGTLGLTGAVGNLGFVSMSMLVMAGYRTYLDVDDDLLPGAAFTFEGFMVSYPAFVLCWTIVYNFRQGVF